jgi:hypothetical protein
MKEGFPAVFEIVLSLRDRFLSVGAGSCGTAQRALTAIAGGGS